MTETVPERVWLVPLGVNTGRIDWSEGMWTAHKEGCEQEHEYVPATALEAAQAREADLAAEVVRLRNALEKIRDRSDQMIWGEDHEIAAAMRDMEECARAALEGRT